MEVIANRSRRSAVPPTPGVVTRPQSGSSAPAEGLPIGVVTKDAPSPLDAFWRQRYPGQHPIPYDELTVRKSLRIYDEMLRDETVAYAHKLKIASRMASGWSLRPPEDKEGNPLPGSEAVMDHVQAQIEQWGRFDEFLEMMLDGTRQGFKLGEIVTRDGKIEGRRAWVVDDVLVRNSRFFAYDADPSGRLLQDGVLEYIDPNPDGGGIQSVWSPASTARHSPDKFVRWAWSPLDSNAYSLYGRSDFYSVYRGYFLKDVMLKGWGETLDTYKHPTAIAISRTGLNDGQRADFIAALQQGLKRKAILIPAEYLPDGMDPQKAVTLHEVTGKADEFGTQIGYDDKVIMRGLLVGQLVAEVGGDGKSGSYALGRQHTMLFLKIMDAVGRSSGRAIGHTFFRPMVRWNLGEDAVALAPDLVWQSAGDAESLERAQIIQTLVEGGIIDPDEPWLREYLGTFPKMDEEIKARRDDERKKRLEAETRPPDVGSSGPKKKKSDSMSIEEPSTPAARSATRSQMEALAVLAEEVLQGERTAIDAAAAATGIVDMTSEEALDLFAPAEQRRAKQQVDVHVHQAAAPPAAAAPAPVVNVNVEKQDPPVVNVNLPAVAPPTINVTPPPAIVLGAEKQDPPVVHVHTSAAAPPTVNIHVPAEKPCDIDIERDKQGRATRITKTPKEPA